MTVRNIDEIYSTDMKRERDDAGTVRLNLRSNNMLGALEYAADSKSVYGRTPALDEVLDDFKTTILRWMENMLRNNVKDGVEAYSKVNRLIGRRWPELTTWWDDHKDQILKELLTLMKHGYVDTIYTMVDRYLTKQAGLKWPELETIMKGCKSEIYRRASLREDGIEEAWSNKYKKSINCSNPKGFSQKAHCAARRKRAAGGKTKSKPVHEGKVTLYTRPDYFGAEVDDSGFEGLPIVNIPLNQLVGFEPDEKMQLPKSKANVRKILAGLKNGDTIPPILVRKHGTGYQVLDGHHRFWAYKVAKKDSIPARLVSDDDIEEIKESFNPDRYVEQARKAIEIGWIDNLLDRMVYGLSVGKISPAKQITELLDENKDKIIKHLLISIKKPQQNMDHISKLVDMLRKMGIEWTELSAIEKSLAVKLGENFADGKGPGRPGDSRRHGIPKNATLAQLDRIGKGSGRKAQLARWQANMRRGRAKAKESMEPKMFFETIAPHGDPQNELRMMRAGTKPAALVNPWEFDKLYRPIIDGMGWEMIEYEIEGFDGHRFYVVAQPGETERAKRIVQLVQYANRMVNAGKQVGPDYHRELGFLLGYKKADIDHFVSNMFGNKSVAEGDVISNKFTTRQAQKNKTPYQFNQEIADRIPMFDPKGRFGTHHKSGELLHGDEVPFARFEVVEKNERIASIIGIAPNGKKYVVSTSPPRLAHALADAYNRGGFTDQDLQPISMRTDEEQNKVGAALTVFDIDETLFHTAAKILVIKDGEVVKELDNREFNTYILEPGESFDFRQFTNARFFHDTSVPIETMWNRAKSTLDGIGRRPGSRVIIVTARSDFDDKELFLNTFRKHGLDIDKIHVHRAGNLNMPSAAAKKKIIGQYLDTKQFDMVRLFDDAESNLRSFLSLQDDHPEIKFKAYMVLDDGSVREYRV